ncbi:MAG TPA: hypothetical protein VLA98_01170 [Solirubrobacteraceae bacterium]|nr:hypothetical protein [Solirubrobacteraceae bacterium]
MLRGTFETGGWRVETWEQAREPGVASRDGLLVDARERGLRLAVVDGVTPTDATPAEAGVDGAVCAAALVRAALLARAGLQDCALAANAALRARGAVPTPRDRPQAAFAAADVSGRGAELLRGGDCEAWVERDGRWERIFPQVIDTAAERARMEAWTRAHPGRPFLEYDRARPEGDDVWTTSALGRLPRPLLQSAAIASCSSLVLATDGARLSEAALDALPAWLERIGEHQRRRPASAWEGGADDVAVLRARRRP